MTDICVYEVATISLKLYVSFAEYSLFYRALLQERPIILWSLIIVATPYLPGPMWDRSDLTHSYARYDAFI